MKNRFFSIMLFLLIGCSLIVSGCSQSKKLNPIAGIVGITANTKMGIAGQMVTSFVISFNENANTSEYKNIGPLDFVIEKNFIDVARFSTLASATPTTVTVKDNKVTIAVDPFYLKGDSDYALSDNNFTIKCRYPGLEYLCSFGYANVTNVTTEVVDQFTAGIEDNMTYRLFTPKDAKKLPLVIWLHGGSGSGTDNKAQLIGYLGASYFAEPSFQEKHSCVVLAPQQPREFGAAKPPNWSKTEFDAMVKIIDGLAQEGTIDKTRVYVVGGSMGGVGVADLIKEYPDYIAAGLRSANGIRLKDGQTAEEFAKSYPGFPNAVVPIFNSVGENDSISNGGDAKQAAEIQQAFYDAGIKQDSYKNQVYTQQDFMDVGLGYTEEDLTDNYVKAYNTLKKTTMTKEELLKKINYSYQHWSWILDIKSDSKIDWLLSHNKIK